MCTFSEYEADILIGTHMIVWSNYGLVFAAYGIGAIAGVSTSGLLLDYHGNYHYVFYYVIALCFLGVYLTSKYISKNNEVRSSEII
ncbi:MAG: hypothetical protein ACYDEX_08425 [Mobilitalea sp.]